MVEWSIESDNSIDVGRDGRGSGRGNRSLIQRGGAGSEQFIADGDRSTGRYNGSGGLSANQGRGLAMGLWWKERNKASGSGRRPDLALMSGRRVNNGSVFGPSRVFPGIKLEFGRDGWEGGVG